MVQPDTNIESCRVYGNTQRSLLELTARGSRGLMPELLAKAPLVLMVSTIYIHISYSYCIYTASAVALLRYLSKSVSNWILKIYHYDLFVNFMKCFIMAFMNIYD